MTQVTLMTQNPRHKKRLAKKENGPVLESTRPLTNAKTEVITQRKPIDFDPKQAAVESTTFLISKGPCHCHTAVPRFRGLGQKPLF